MILNDGDACFFSLCCAPSSEVLVFGLGSPAGLETRRPIDQLNHRAVLIWLRRRAKPSVQLDRWIDLLFFSPPPHQKTENLCIESVRVYLFPGKIHAFPGAARQIPKSQISPERVKPVLSWALRYTCTLDVCDSWFVSFLQRVEFWVTVFTFVCCLRFAFLRVLCSLGLKWFSLIRFLPHVKVISIICFILILDKYPL